MTGQFDAATAVRRVVTDRARPVYEGEVASGWDVDGVTNGGYLLAIAGRAMADAAGRRPLSVTGHFLAQGTPGPCRIDVDVVRAGRRLATVTAAMWQEERRILQVLGTFGEPAATEAPRYLDGAPPELVAYDDLEPVSPPVPGVPDRVPSIVRKLDLRIRPSDTGFRTGQQKSGVAEVRGWFAFADQAPVDVFGLLHALDAFAPSVFNLDLPVGWVPTVELTVHIRGVPVPGPLRCAFRTRFVAGGLLEEDGEAWDAAGRLVAQSRQLALVPRARRKVSDTVRYGDDGTSIGLQA